MSLFFCSCPLCGKRDIHGDHEMGGQDCQRSLSNSLLIGCHSRSSQFLTCKICRCNIQENIINCENSVNYLQTSTCIICHQCLTSCFTVSSSSSPLNDNEKENNSSYEAEEKYENSPSRCVTCKTKKVDAKTNHIVSFQRNQINYQVNFCDDCWQVINTEINNVEEKFRQHKEHFSPMKQKSLQIFKRLIKAFVNDESIEEMIAVAKNGLR